MSFNVRESGDGTLLHQEINTDKPTSGRVTVGDPPNEVGRVRAQGLPEASENYHHSLFWSFWSSSPKTVNLAGCLLGTVFKLSPYGLSEGIRTSKISVQDGADP